MKKANKKREKISSSIAGGAIATEKRKCEHIDLVLRKNVQYGRSAGFENVQFVHCALPEMNFSEVDLGCSFLGKKMKFPLMIEAMTGGYGEAKAINKALASAAEKHGIALGLGSQRAMLENGALKETYSVRDVAPTIPIIGNIGAAQLKKYPIESIEGLASAIDADAIAIHLNVLQEVLQPEGDRDFSGVLDKITELCNRNNIPIIVKETGAGINKRVALALKAVGVRYVDIAGAGGTSWAKVEYLRGKAAVPGFEEWGITTTQSLEMCKDTLPLIASGGIRSGIDCAKAIALGADLAGAAYPFLDALKGKKLDALLTEWENQLKTAAFLTGSKNHEDLKEAQFIRTRA